MIDEQLHPLTVLNAVQTREQAREAWNQTATKLNDSLVHTVSTEHGGFAWEIIEESLDDYYEGERMTDEEFQTMRNNAIAVVKGEQTIEDVASYVTTLNRSGHIAHTGVAFLVMAAKHQLNEDVEVLRYHNARFRGWVIRPAINNLRAGIEVKRQGATHPAVAIVTDDKNMTHFMAFKNCWETDFEGISSWRGQPFETIGYYDEPSNFVSAIQAVVDAFNSKDYGFLAHYG